MPSFLKFLKGKHGVKKDEEPSTSTNTNDTEVLLNGDVRLGAKVTFLSSSHLKFYEFVYGNKVANQLSEVRKQRDAKYASKKQSLESATSSSTQPYAALESSHSTPSKRSIAETSFIETPSTSEQSKPAESTGKPKSKLAGPPTCPPTTKKSSFTATKSTLAVPKEKKNYPDKKPSTRNTEDKSTTEKSSNDSETQAKAKSGEDTAKSTVNKNGNTKDDTNGESINKINIHVNPLDSLNNTPKKRLLPDVTAIRCKQALSPQNSQKVSVGVQTSPEVIAEQPRRRREISHHREADGRYNALTVHGSEESLWEEIEYEEGFKHYKSYSRPTEVRLAPRSHEDQETVRRHQKFASTVFQLYHSRDSGRSPPGRPISAMEEHERKIIIEFCHLLEKSKQLFNGLRELPQYGHKQWSIYFGRTFDIYTRLWKFQQQHRTILDQKYGMKRWQIGEIASKIGQLYYHFYLRTSETAYLTEAYAFYSAIRSRAYYTRANREDKCELMVKKLRFYTRFIVVSLLLKKMKLVKDLIKELDRQIIEYGNTYDPDDQVEWTVVVDEIKAFVHAEPVVAVIHPDNYAVTLTHRLTPHMIPPVERTPQMNLALEEILVVGSSSQQAKFSELTIDMFRMLQTLEREPSGEFQHTLDESPRQRYTSALGASQDGLEPSQKTLNPHKYLLFKPSPSQMLVYLASGCNDLPPNGALLLYLSADGHMPQPSKHPEEAGYDMGGLITTSKSDIYRDCSKDPKASTGKHKEPQCLYPGDLYPFTRRPLFLIVDSDNSYAFQNIPRHFGQPMVTLMSPLELPPSYHDRRTLGSLFTLFLHSPLQAFCYCCDISTAVRQHWDRAQAYVDTFLAEASAIVVRSRIDISYISFMGDDFLRVLMLRYVFCEVVLRLHRGFRGRNHLPRSSPAMPEELFDHPALIHLVIDLAGHLQVRSHFHDPTVAPLPSATKE